MKKNVLAVMVIFGMCSTAALAESANVKDALFYAYKTNVTQPKLDDDSFIRDVTREFNFEVRHSPMPPDGTLRIP
ncbi:hypothetical protein [Aeromonas veronii]|uniref:hypothetical protein n=1 Tax=Aeromonas veronii TaxID=654 RepID=UPI003BA272FF